MHRVVPELIVENYRAGRFHGEFTAVGMFLDLSGFSTMTDTLMQQGQHGAEVLASLMHGVFNPLVESIFDYGGKIVSFAGDGIMALYPIEEDIKQTALRALASAWVVQQRLVENPDRRTIYGKFTFSAKIGLAVGAVSWKIMRSKDGEQATYYFRGTAVDESARSEHQANAGEIILTREINDILGEDVLTRPNDSFYRFIRFKVEIPKKTTNNFPPVDLGISRIFMPEEVIVEGVRGEFRQIANLFIRIPNVSDDELNHFINEVFELEKKYGGLVTRVDFGDKGCNMLLLWGAPVAYENDIGRALNFALDLRSRMSFPITAGVTYYIAHAGYLGSELCEDYTCYGWGVNLAARFMMSAPDGAIWVDDRIAQRVSRRFALEYVGSQRFKGFAAEQKVHILKYRKMESDVMYQGDMVGREDELARLREFVEPLWHGKFAGVLTISGDAGIGKGRLVHEFSASELFNSNPALWANCKTDQILRQSFNPLRGWLLRYFGNRQNENIEERKKGFDAKLNELLASIPDPELGRELDRTRSFLGSLIDLQWDGSLYEQLDAEARYNNTILSLIALLKAESIRQPVILFIDDVQFIDEDTSVFLTKIKHSLQLEDQPYPIAIILTLRKQGIRPPILKELSDGEISLEGMPEAAVTKLVENILNGNVSSNLEQLVLSRSEGNPYFAEQVVRYLQEENQLENGENGWDRIARAQDLVLPGDIRAVLVARLDKLKREVKNTVQTASILGREFDISVLFQMLGSESTTRGYVLEAEQAAVWSMVDEMLYIFYHGLLRDAAYSMQMQARRQELHIIALNALEILYEEDLKNHYAELAYHAEQGGLRSKAQKYYTLAGKISAELYRNVEAVEYFTNALALTDYDDLETQFDLLAERVELYSRMGKRDLQLNDLNSLKQRAEQLKDDACHFQAMTLYARYFRTIGDYDNSIKSAEQANEKIDEAVPPDLIINLQHVWASSLLRFGKPEIAMKQASIGLEVARKHNKRLDEAKMLTEMGLIALERSDPGIAHEYLEESLVIAREMKDLRMESYALNNLAISEGSVRGNYSLAREHYEQAYEIAKEIGDRYSEGNCLANLGFSAGMQGDIAAASAYHQKALQVSKEIGNVNQETFTLINLSAVAGLMNNALEAIDYANKALALSISVQDRSAEAWSLLYMGHAFLLTGEYERARKAYQNSLALRNEMKQVTLSWEPLAGLVETALCINDIDTAVINAEKIIAHIDGGGSLDGTDEPMRIYYTCYLYLDKQKDPRADQILQRASELLDTRVSSFKNVQIQEMYINNFPWRKALRDAASKSWG